MTLREKLEIEHPECIDEKWHGGCKDCPHQYGYKKMEECECDSKTVNEEICKRCWDQEYEGELTPQEEMIMRLRTSLENNRRALEHEYCDNRELLKQLRELEDYVENKTGTFNFPFAPKALYVQKQFEKLWYSRNRWRASFIGIILGFVIGAIVRSIIGG